MSRFEITFFHKTLNDKRGENQMTTENVQGEKIVARENRYELIDLNGDTIMWIPITCLIKKF